jgi:hypothetical protein
MKRTAVPHRPFAAWAHLDGGAIRRELAEAWGEMGAAWGVTVTGHRPKCRPSLMARLGAAAMNRNERSAKRSGLSHRAASLGTCRSRGVGPSWSAVPEPRGPSPRTCRPAGPSGRGVAYLAVGDHFQWFWSGHRRNAQGPRGRSHPSRVLEQKAKEAARPRRPPIPRTTSSRRLRDWLASVRGLTIGCSTSGRALPSQLEPRENGNARLQTPWGRVCRIRTICACSTCSVGSTTNDVPGRGSMPVPALSPVRGAAPPRAHGPESSAPSRRWTRTERPPGLPPGGLRLRRVGDQPVVVFAAS